jgi:predicted enzyme related to lactoylglutathione lyase
MRWSLIYSANRDLGTPKTRYGTRFTTMSHVFVHTEELAQAVNWYEAFLSTQTLPYVHLGNLPYIPMDQGANLLFDDKRLSNSSMIYDPYTKSPIDAKPIVILETLDIYATYNYIREKNVLSSEITEKWGSSYFCFIDPDGNCIMVKQTSA